jgi:translation initiation factor 2 subunit 2
MADEPEDVDMSLTFGKRKKKKGQKVMVSLDDDEPETTSEAPAAAPEADGGDNIDEELTFKKKKKKKKAFVPVDLDDTPAGGDTTTTIPDKAIPAVDFESLDTEYKLPLKKKRKMKKVPEEFADEGIEEGVEVENGEQGKIVDTSAWANSDRDYEYSELLERVFDIMRAKNPNLVQGEKRRFIMKPPQVIRLGSKKSGFINFLEICKMMHRQPDHVLGYLLAELGTSGTLDGSNALVLKGRFQQKQMESVLRRYIREYVTCHTCKSPDTILSRENRLFFMTCETCGARQSVSSIKAGFSAVVGRRSKIRAAQGN